MTIESQVGPRRFLDLQRAGEGDVAVEVAFVEFVEEDGGDAGQRGVAEHLAQEDALGDVLDAGAGAGDVVEADAVADLLRRATCRVRARRGRRASGRAGGGVGGRRRAARSPSNPASRSICGTCVDLPEPVGAWRMSRRLPAGHVRGDEGVGQFVDGQAVGGGRCHGGFRGAFPFSATFPPSLPRSNSPDSCACAAASKFSATDRAAAAPIAARRAGSDAMSDQRPAERDMVAFGHQPAADAVFDGLGDAAVRRGKNRQSGRHRFEQRIGDAFLVAVAAEFARMQEKMRFVEPSAEIVLRQEPRELDAVGDAEFGGELAQGWPQRTFAGERQPGIGKRAHEIRERAQRRRQALLFDQTARLEQPEPAPPRPRARRNGNSSRGIPVRFRRIFSGGQPSRTSASTNERERASTSVDPLAHFAHGVAVGFSIQFDQHVRSVERDDRRPRHRVVTQQRQELHPDVAEKNVQQRRNRASSSASSNRVDSIRLRSSGRPRICLSRMRRSHRHGPWGTSTTSSNGKRSPFSRFCVKTVSEKRRTARNCR